MRQLSVVVSDDDYKHLKAVADHHNKKLAAHLRDVLLKDLKMSEPHCKSEKLKFLHILTENVLAYDQLSFDECLEVSSVFVDGDITKDVIVADKNELLWSFSFNDEK